MKKCIILILCFVSLLSNSFSQDVIQIENGRFSYLGEIIYPTGLNYPLIMYSNNAGDFWIAPYYLEGVPVTDWKDNPNKFMADLNRIKSLGFDYIKTLHGFSLKDQKIESYNIDLGKHVSTPVVSFSILFENINNLLICAEAAGLKTLLTVQGDVNDKTYFTNFYRQLAQQFANDSRILAYELLTEPNNCSNSKQTMHNTVDEWYQTIKSKTANLVTLGLFPDPTNDFDPSIFDVDFIAYHTYPLYNSDYNYMKESYKTKLYWYYNSVNKPWLLGETGFCATDNSTTSIYDWGTLNNQKDFAIFSQRFSKSLNSIGYTWFDYQDNRGGYWGVMDINGNEKPVSTVFNSNYDLLNDALKVPLYYYECTEGSNYIIEGSILGNNGLPVENVIVIGKNYYTDINGKYISYPVGKAITNSYGYFKLNADEPILYIYYANAGSCIQELNNPINHHYYNLKLESCNGKNPNISLSKTVKTSESYTSLPTSSLVLSNTIVEGNGLTGGVANFKANQNISITNSTFKKGAKVNISIGPIYPDCNYDNCPPIKLKSAEITNYTTVPKSEINYNYRIYPNPTDGIIHVSTNNYLKYSIDIIDLYGKTVYSNFYNQQELTLNLLLPKGSYIIKISSDQKTEIQKLIIQ